MTGRVRPDLERTVIDPSTPEPSQVRPEVIVVDAVAQQFIPRQISNRSCECIRDVINTVCSAGGSVVCGFGASESSDKTATIIFAVASAVFGIIAIRMILYGVMIRRCPQSQRFWLNRN